MYKVHVYILNKKPGDVVKEGDRDFDAFKFWAERGDKRSGLVICTHCMSQERKPDPFETEPAAVLEDAGEQKASKKKG